MFHAQYCPIREHIVSYSYLVEYRHPIPLIYPCLLLCTHWKYNDLFKLNCTWYWMCIPSLNSQGCSNITNVNGKPGNAEFLMRTVEVNFSPFLQCNQAGLYWVVDTAINLHPNPLNTVVLKETRKSKQHAGEWNTVHKVSNKHTSPRYSHTH